MNERIPLWKRGMTVRMHSDSYALRAVLTGEFDPHDAEKTFVEILDTAALKKSDKVLIDGRELLGEPDVIHRFLYGEFAALTAERYVVARRIHRTAQFAYVLKEPVLDPLRFGEAVAQHRGMQVKAFDDMDEALAWLAAEPDSIPLWKKGMSLRIEAAPGLLRAVATGEFSTDEAERTFVELLDAVARHKVDKVLFDGRELAGEPHMIERFLYVDFAALTAERYVKTRRIPRPPQLAYVVVRPILDPLKFGESLAVDRGMWVRVFEKPEDAEAWLASEPGDEHGTRSIG